MSKHLVTQPSEIVILQKGFADAIAEIYKENVDSKGNPVPLTKFALEKLEHESVFKVDGESIKLRPTTLIEFDKMPDDIRAANILMWFRSQEAGYLSTAVGAPMSQNKFLKKWKADIDKVAEIWKELNRVTQYGHNGPFTSTDENKALRKNVNVDSIDIETIDTHFPKHQRDLFWTRQKTVLKKADLTKGIKLIDELLASPSQVERYRIQEEIRELIWNKKQVVVGGGVTNNIRKETQPLRATLSKGGGMLYTERAAELRTELNFIVQRWIREMHQDNVVSVIQKLAVTYKTPLYTLRIEDLQDTDLKYEIRHNPNMPGELVTLNGGVAVVTKTHNLDTANNRKHAISNLIDGRSSIRSKVNTPNTRNLVSTALITTAEYNRIKSYLPKVIKGISITRIDAGTAVIPVGDVNNRTELLVFKNILNKGANIIVDSVKTIKALNSIEHKQVDVDASTKRLLQAYDKDMLSGAIGDNMYDSIFDFKGIEDQAASKTFTGVNPTKSHGSSQTLLKPSTAKGSNWMAVLKSLAQTQSISGFAITHLEFTDKFKAHLKANPSNFIAELHRAQGGYRDLKNTIIDETGVKNLPISHLISQKSKSSQAASFSNQSAMKAFYNVMQFYTATTEFELKPLNLPYPVYFVKQMYPMQSRENSILQEVRGLITLLLGDVDPASPEYVKKSIEIERDVRTNYTSKYYNQITVIDDAASFLMRYAARDTAGSEHWATNIKNVEIVNQNAKIGFEIPANTDFTMSPRMAMEGTLGSSTSFYLDQSYLDSGAGRVLNLPTPAAAIWKEMTRKIYATGNAAFIDILWWAQRVPSQLNDSVTYEEVIVSNRNPQTYATIIDEHGSTGKGNKGKSFPLYRLREMSTYGGGQNKGATILYHKGLLFSLGIQNEVSDWMLRRSADFDKFWVSVANENWYRNRLFKSGLHIDKPLSTGTSTPRSGALVMPFDDTNFALRALNMGAVATVVPAFATIKFVGTKISDISFLDDMIKANDTGLTNFFTRFDQVVNDNLHNDSYLVRTGSKPKPHELMSVPAFNDDELDKLYKGLLNGPFVSPYGGGTSSTVRKNQIMKELGTDHPRFLAYEHQMKIREMLLSIYGLMGANKSEFDLTSTKSKEKRGLKLLSMLGDIQEDITTSNSGFIQTMATSSAKIIAKQNSTINFDIASLLDNQDYVLEDGRLFFFQDGVKINTGAILNTAQVDAVNALQGRGIDLAVVVKDGIKYLEVRTARGVPTAVGGALKRYGKAAGAVLAIIPIDAIAGVIYHYDNEQMFKDWWNASACDPHDPACKASIKVMHDNLSEAARQNFFDKEYPLFGLTPRESWNNTADYVSDAYYMVMHNLYKVVSAVPWDEIMEGALRKIIDTWENHVDLYEFKLTLEGILIDLRNGHVTFLKALSRWIDVYNFVWERSKAMAKMMWTEFTYYATYVGHGVVRAFDLISVLWSVALDIDGMRTVGNPNIMIRSLLTTLLTYKSLRLIEGMSKLIDGLQAKQREAERLMTQEDRDELNSIIFNRTGMGY